MRRFVNQHMPWGFLAPLALVPLICRVHELDISAYVAGTDFANWVHYFDVYSWIKAQTLYVAAGFAAIWLVCSAAVNPWGLWRAAGWLWLQFVLVTLVATVASEHPQVAWWGFPQHFFGFWAVLATVILGWAVATAVARGFGVQRIVTAMALGSVPVTIYAVAQRLGYEPISEAWVRPLIAPGLVPELSIGQLGDHLLSSSSLYNPNYVGVYAATLAPVVLLSGQGRARRWYWALGASLIVLAWLSGSRSAQVALFAALVGAAMYGLRGIKLTKMARNILAAGGVTALGYCAVIAVILPQYHSPPRTLFNVAGGVVRYRPPSSQGVSLEPLGSTGFVVKDFFGEHELTLTFPAVDMTMARDKLGGAFYFRLGGSQGEVMMHYNDLPEIPLMLAPKAGFKIMAWKALHDTMYSAHTEPCFEDRAFSNRGYIWCRTFPMLKWLGSGPDVFGAEFENRDFEGKINFFNIVEIINDKPHSFYLQVAHGAGYLGLIMLLAATVCALRNVLKAPRTWLMAGCFGSLLAALVAGIFNDLYIGVAPVFVVLFGIGSGVGNARR